MESTIGELASTRLKPLGGNFLDRYWPCNEDQVAHIEATLGFSLPSDYRTYLQQFGIAGPQGRRVFYGEKVVYLRVLYGHHPSNEGYSVDTRAAQYLEPVPLLQIGLVEGGAIYLDETGAVLQESDFEAGVTRIAGSFLEFISELEVDEE